MKIYLIGSLRNEQIPKLAAHLRLETGHEIFDDWYAAGPEADDYWRDYEKDKGHGLREALEGYAAQHVFEFDKHNLDDSDAVVLAWPAGKSAHLEFGYCIGKGKPGWILLDGEPERFDVMLNFATGVFTKREDLVAAIKKHAATKRMKDRYTRFIYPPVIDNGDGTTSPITSYGFSRAAYPREAFPSFYQPLDFA